MLATQLDGERGDAYVAFKSVMRVHARDGGWRRRIGGGAARSTKRKLSKGTERTGEREEGEGDKRNVESKKQKGREEIKVRFES